MMRTGLMQETVLQGVAAVKLKELLMMYWKKGDAFNRLISILVPTMPENKIRTCTWQSYHGSSTVQHLSIQSCLEFPFSIDRTTLQSYVTKIGGLSEHGDPCRFLLFIYLAQSARCRKNTTIQGFPESSLEEGQSFRYIGPYVLENISNQLI